MNTPRVLVLGVVRALFDFCSKAVAAAVLVELFHAPSFWLVLAALYVVPFAMRRG